MIRIGLKKSKHSSLFLCSFLMVKFHFKPKSKGDDAATGTTGDDAQATITVTDVTDQSTAPTEELVIGDTPSDSSADIQIDTAQVAPDVTAEQQVQIDSAEPDPTAVTTPELKLNTTETDTDTDTGTEPHPDANPFVLAAEASPEAQVAIEPQTEGGVFATEVPPEPVSSADEVPEGTPEKNTLDEGIEANTPEANDPNDIGFQANTEKKLEENPFLNTDTKEVSETAVSPEKELPSASESTQAEEVAETSSPEPANTGFAIQIGGDESATETAPLENPFTDTTDAVSEEKKTEEPTPADGLNFNFGANDKTDVDRNAPQEASKDEDPSSEDTTTSAVESDNVPQEPVQTAENILSFSTTKETSSSKEMPAADPEATAETLMTQVKDSLESKEAQIEDYKQQIAELNAKIQAEKDAIRAEKNKLQSVITSLQEFADGKNNPDKKNKNKRPNRSEVKDIAA